MTKISENPTQKARAVTHFWLFLEIPRRSELFGPETQSPKALFSRRSRPNLRSGPWALSFATKNSDFSSSKCRKQLGTPPGDWVCGEAAKFKIDVNLQRTVTDNNKYNPARSWSSPDHRYLCVLHRDFWPYHPGSEFGEFWPKIRWDSFLVKITKLRPLEP